LFSHPKTSGIQKLYLELIAGTSSAISISKAFMYRSSISTVLLVGITAGIPVQEMQLGDLIVPGYIADLESGKVKKAGLELPRPDCAGASAIDSGGYRLGMD
jgi:hypothetical protein